MVVVITGLAATAVLLTLPDGHASLRRQADTFARHLLHARDEAVLGGRPIQVTVDSAGYHFARRQFSQWEPLQEGPFTAQVWHDGVQPRMPARQSRLGFRFSPTGDSEPQSVQLTLGTAEARVGVQSNGEIGIDGIRN